jgi:N6-L-threonylcarbamoyladenine synthase
LNEVRDIVLGMDTSNYTSSVALADAARGVVADLREQLPVKRGARGLRQSEAFFLHVDNIPALVRALLGSRRGRIGAVAVSERPRPADGSYMPVFRAGLRFAELLADALNAPLFRFSHQEGHIRAALHGNAPPASGRFLAWHIAGGTSELLLAEDGGARLTVVGGSKDISFGQLLDRAGVALGMDFPAGAALDALAEKGECADERPDRGAETAGPAGGRARLARIASDGFFFNLSGMETQCLRGIADGVNAPALARAIFENAADCLLGISAAAARAHDVSEVLFTGGVSASKYLRKRVLAAKSGPKPIFAGAALSGDNAVGTALLGVEKLWP